MDTSSATLDEVKKHYAAVVRGARGACVAKARSDTLLQRGNDLAAALYSTEQQATLPQAAISSCRGCADSVGRAALQQGEVVLDLGSGGGADAIIAAQMVGANGQVYGLDINDEMLELARESVRETGLSNVEFLKGHIESVPLASASIDVVLSNCVLNFSVDKHAVLREAFRVLRPGGRIIISDIVAFAPVFPEAFSRLCAFVGCLNGMCSDEDYRAHFEDAGFEQIRLMQTALYTYASMERSAARQGREALLAPLREYAKEVDRVSGSVIIEARKPSSKGVTQ